MSQLTFEHLSSGTVVEEIDFWDDGHVIDYIPTSSNKETVTEKFRALIEIDTATALEAKINNIERLLRLAKKHPSGPEGVWVLFAPDRSSTPYQSRVIDGQLILDDRTEHLRNDGKKIIHVVIERKNYWETQTPDSLLLSNAAVTNQVVAPIANTQDATRELYVTIAGSQIEGVLPTPAILEFSNSQNDATLVDDLLVGVVYGDGISTLPTPGTLIQEGAGSADASCSGGSYAALSWVDDDENSLTTWTIASGSFLQKRYRAVARLQASVAYTDLWLKAKLLVGSTVIAETQWSLVEAGVQLVIIGSMTIPPYALGEAIDLGNITLALYEKRASGAGSLNLDYLLLMPQDSWRRYGAISGLAYNETLIDDPVREVLVTKYSTSSYKVTQKILEGEPLMLRPGVTNTLYFLQQNTAGVAAIARTANVTIKTHPRRLTV
jgi:hypothetical protein